MCSRACWYEHGERNSKYFYNLEKGNQEKKHITSLVTMVTNNKTSGTDGFTPEFYRYFWNLFGSFMVSSFNYAFRNGTLSVSQRQGIISLIPKKKKNTEYLKHWRPVSLLNVDYKIATKSIALGLEKILPNLIHP